MRQHVGFGTESEVMFALNDADDSVRCVFACVCV
jgi:hypothetical protein